MPLNGNGNGNGNGGLRKILIGIFTSVVTALLIAALLGLIALRDRVGDLESSWGVSEGAKGNLALRDRVTVLEGRAQRLEDFRSEGGRFTKADGEQLRWQLEKEIDYLRQEIARRH